MNKTKTAMITVCGRPNVGKSSLTNALVGEKIAIVSNKPQTTRNRIYGVVNRGDTQYVLLDTPGFHKARNRLGDYMVKVTRESIADVDAVLLLVEPVPHVGIPESELIEKIKASHLPAILCINKIDTIERKDDLLAVIAAYSEAYPFDAIIPISARTHEGDKVAALDLGADDYIEKPFGTSELLARIRTAIRHTRTGLDNDSIAQSGKYTVRDLTIDYDKHHVLMRGEDVHLTLNEFKIVALLGKYAGKVLTYDFLIREIWGPKAKADNQILRVNMANIRRKIEKNPAAPEYIFTEIGVGYRMLENE